MQRHRHFEALLKSAKKCDPIPVAVVCPHNTTSLGGAILALLEPYHLNENDFIDVWNGKRTIAPPKAENHSKK